MRQDQEALIAEGVDHHVGDLGGGQHPPGGLHRSLHEYRAVVGRDVVGAQ
jgi:hypothetical protein